MVYVGVYEFVNDIMYSIITMSNNNNCYSVHAVGGFRPTPVAVVVLSNVVSVGLFLL